VLLIVQRCATLRQLWTQASLLVSHMLGRSSQRLLAGYRNAVGYVGSLAELNSLDRFEWPEVKRYWELRSSYWARSPHDGDPHALQNVCHPGAPLWLNRYYARFQEMAYQALLDLLPPPAPKQRALDVSLGAGRWCRLLYERGYHTVGIDLQPDLIQSNRSRYPHIDFLCTPVQEYSAEEPFDLVSSVTVIQHVPFEEQKVVIRKLRELLRRGGYVVMLENIYDEAPHVFSRAIDDWNEVFEDAGFRNVAIQRYDYSLFIRLYSWLTQPLVSALRPQRSRGKGLTPEELATPRDLRRSVKVTRAIYDLPKRLAVGLDTMVEPVLMRGNMPLPTVHCGFIFQAM
jgi:2-polyprenyl-3-methyl-5-hydroxy-6-metoxy-1,4-benzoquinol methylase